MNKLVNYCLVSFKHFVPDRFLSLFHLIFKTLCDMIFTYFIQQIFLCQTLFCSYGLFIEMKCAPMEQENENKHKCMNRIISGSGQCFEGNRIGWESGAWLRLERIFNQVVRESLSEMITDWSKDKKVHTHHTHIKLIWAEDQEVSLAVQEQL